MKDLQKIIDDCCNIAISTEDKETSELLKKCADTILELQEQNRSLQNHIIDLQNELDVK